MPRRYVSSGARGREFESPRSDQFNQELSTRAGTPGDVFGSVLRARNLTSSIEEEGTREHFAVLVLVEPRALDVEEFQASRAARQGKGVDRELRDRAIRARIRLVVQHVHATVAHLQEIDVARDRPLGRADARRELDAVLAFECRDVLIVEPDSCADARRSLRACSRCRNQ